MPRDGSGTFTLVAGNPVVADTIIDPDWANDTLADIATALTNSLDNSVPATARSRLGLGTASIRDTGTAGATVPLLNSSPTFSGTVTFSGGVNFDGAVDFDGTLNLSAALTTSSTVTLTYTGDDCLISDPETSVWFQGALAVDGTATLEDVVSTTLSALTADLGNTTLQAANFETASLSGGVDAWEGDINYGSGGPALRIQASMVSPLGDPGAVQIVLGTANEHTWEFTPSGHLLGPIVAAAATDDRHVMTLADTETLVSEARVSGMQIRAMGQVNSDGTKLSGTGFTVSRSSAGKYTITLSAALPSTTACAVFVSTSGVPGREAPTVTYQISSTTSILVETGWGSSWANQDEDFSIAVYAFV